MIRLKLVRVFQGGAMGPIRIYKRARPADAPKPLLDPEVRHAEEVALAGADRESPAATAKTDEELSAVSSQLSVDDEELKADSCEPLAGSGQLTRGRTSV
jgi:hypothetical protein